MVVFCCHLQPACTHLIVVLHELDDDPQVVGVVLDGDDPHDVGRVLGVGVLAVLVGQQQTRVRLANLQHGVSP